MALFRIGKFRGEPVIVEETFEAQLVEVQARNAEAAQLVDAALAEQSDLEHDDRDLQLIDVCLSLRAALAPAPVGSQLVRAAAPVPVSSERWL